MRNRLGVIFTALFVSLAACGSESSGPADAVTLDQVNGLWVLPFTRTTNCVVSGSVASGTVYLQLDIPSGGTNATANDWGFSSTTITRTATGSVSLASGQITQVLIHSNGTAASRLTGTISASGTFTGSLVDPAPSWQPQLSTGGCEYSVTGGK